jgi:phosphatidylserine/phosphatidylglycerophosphate/cardiolipin synthase-like enzyme
MQVSVYFQEIKKEIINNLKKAKHEIKVAVAWLTDEDIIRTLGQRSKEGVDVKVIISDSKENFRNTKKFNELIRNQSKLFIVSPKFLHHKFCIIDNSVIINGSYNWTYYAQSNEENILVLTLDETSQEDVAILNKFNAKFTFYCDKVSINVTESNTLNEFKQSGKEATVLSKIDEAEIKLREDLEDDVRNSFATAKSLNIQISSYLLDKMKIDGGGVEFIKRLINDEISSGEMKSGFKKLEEPIPHRVDLSLEYLVSRPKYQSLFTQKEIEFCKSLMAKYKL